MKSSDSPIARAGLPILLQGVKLASTTEEVCDHNPNLTPIVLTRSGYESSDDSDSEYKHSRAVSRRKSDRHLKIVPCGDKCDDHPQKMASRNKAKSRDSDLDSDYSSSEEFEKRAKHRNRKLLYTGLACVTTVAAANNIYQNTKAHHARRKQVREGEMCTSEVKRLKNKALLMDLFTVGVIGVGINNCRMGWKRVEAIKQEGR